MKLVGKILGIGKTDVGENVFGELCAIYPAGQRNDRFECLLDASDQRFRDSFRCLERHGFKPFTGRKRAEANDVSIKFERQYDPSDLNEAPYLRIEPQKMLRSYQRNSDGLVQLIAANLKGDIDVASPSPPVVVVSSNFKARIQALGASGSVFRPTEVLGKAAAIRFQGQFWEWVSDIDLPWLSPPCKFIDGVTGDEVSGDSKRPFVLREGLEAPEILYTPAEFHYRASEIKMVQPFDVALVREQFNGPFSRPLVLSNRMYKLCEEMNVSAGWIPVRIDLD